MYSFRNVTKIFAHRPDSKSSLFVAIVLILMAVLLLDLMGVIIKFLAPKYSIVQIQIARNSFGFLPIFVLLYFTMKPKEISEKFNLYYKALATCRGLSVVFAQVCFYLALSRLDFAVVSTLVFTEVTQFSKLYVPNTLLKKPSGKLFSTIGTCLKAAV